MFWRHYHVQCRRTSLHIFNGFMVSKNKDSVKFSLLNFETPTYFTVNPIRFKLKVSTTKMMQIANSIDPDQTAPLEAV